MFRLKINLPLLFVLFALFLAKPEHSLANCWISGVNFDNCSSQCPGNVNYECRPSGVNVAELGWCQNTGTQCLGHAWTCDTQPEAAAICGGSLGNCPGTCNSSSCGDNGSGNCSDFNGDLNRCRDVAGCYEDGGVCSGKYCKNANGSVTDCPNIARDTCSSLGCQWVPNFGSCAASSTCTGGTCVNECGDTTACTSCTPESDATFCSRQGKNCGIFTGTDNCLASRTVNCGSCAASYTCSDNVCVCSASCTIGVSPLAMTLIAGHTGGLSSSVTITDSCGGTVSSVGWVSSNPAVASVSSPGTTTTVAAWTAGTTNVNATATLSPTGSCTTSGTGGNSNPTTVTVARAYFQTFGGNVTSKGRIENPYLPATKFICGR